MCSTATRLQRPSAFMLTFFVLAACSSSGQKDPDPNIFPAGYKQEILDTMTKVLPDPANVRGAFVSEPVLTPVNKEQRYTACVRFSARNPAQQEGSTDRIAYFYAGHLNQLVEATKEQCEKAAYKPFPEMEKLCAGKSCK